MSTSRFEVIRMKDDEPFDDFYVKLNDALNSRSNLGEKIPDTNWHVYISKNIHSKDQASSK